MDPLSRRIGLVVGVLVMMVLAVSLRDMPGADRIPPARADGGMHEAGAQDANVPEPSLEPVRYGASSHQRPGPRPWPLHSVGTPRREEHAREAGTMSGRVVDEAGASVEGVELTFLHEGASQLVTTEAGAFSLEGRGRHVLVLAEAPGFLPLAPPVEHSPYVFTLARGAHIREVTIRMERARPFQVTLEEDGVPVEGTVRVLRNGLADAAEYTTSSGRAQVEARAGDVLEGTSETGFGRALVQTMDLVAGRKNLVLNALALRTIEGRVISLGAREPIPGARVELHADVPLETRSDGEGYFRFDAPEGPASVWASAAGYAGEGQRVGEGPLELVLSRGASIAGRVVGDDGALPACIVMLRVHLGAVERAPRGAQLVVGDGAFRLEGIARGRYDLVVSAEGYASSTQVVDVHGDEDVGELRLVRGERLLGRVVDESGEAVAGAEIELEGALGDSTLPLVRGARTDDEGRFSLEGLEGLVSLAVHGPAHHSRIVQARPPAEIEVALRSRAEDEAPELELAGIGAALRAVGDAIRVDAVLPGSGAAQAGLNVGARILRIDGAPVEGLDFHEIIQRIRGPEGSLVSLHLEGIEAPLVVERVVVRTSE